MDEQDQQKIRRNFVFLSSHLVHFGGLTDFLYSNGIIEDHHLEILRERDTKHDGAHYLLNIIQRKCPIDDRARLSPYKVFLEGLQNNGFEHIAEVLEATVVKLPDDEREKISPCPVATDDKSTIQNEMKLRKRYNWLVDRLDTVQVCEYLVQEGVFEMDDIERIDREITLKDKAKRFIGILLTKQNDKAQEQGIDAVQCFFECLCKSEQSFVAHELQNTKLNLQAFDKDHKVKSWLAERYETFDGAFVSLQEVQQYVTARCSAEKTRNEWTPANITTIVKDIFSGAELESQEKSNIKTVQNIRVKLQDKNVPSDLLEHKSVLHETKTEKTKPPSEISPEKKEDEKGKSDMVDWSVDEVCDWLKNTDIDEDIIKQFRQESIDGASLADYKYEELKCDMPDLPAGVRKKILRERDNYFKDDKVMEMIQRTDSKTDVAQTRDKSQRSDSRDGPSTHQLGKTSSTARSGDHLSEIHRTFDTDVDITFKYRRQSMFPPPESRPGNLITSLKKYLEIDLTGKLKTGMLYLACAHKRP